MNSDVRLCLPPFFVPLVRGGFDGALGEWPVWTWPVVGAPSAAPTAAKNGDVGGGGTESSSPAATGSDEDAATVAAADGTAAGSAPATSSTVSVLP